MNKSFQSSAVIVLLDLLIALFSFWISRYFGDLPRWYWLVLSSVIWVAVGLMTNKLSFSQYKKLRYLYGSLFVVNIGTGALIFLSFRSFIPDYYYDYSILIATALIFVLESILYYCIRLFVYNKIPYFYEPPIIDESIEPIKHIDTPNTTINQAANALIESVKNGDSKPFELLQSQSTTDTVIIESSEPEEVFQCKVKTPLLIVHNKPLNHIRHINTLFSFTNYKLDDNGYIACRCVTSAIRKERIMSQIPTPLNQLIYLFDYTIHRVISKLSISKGFYYWITKGERRALTRVEVLGRLYRAGFDVVYETVIDSEFYVIAKKIQEPIRQDKPSNGVLIRLKRNGKDGKKIGVYKFRTMHAYSEYLQPYIYKTEGLTKDSGRYNNDYRISPSGNFMRKVFVDELPMLINWLKGDLKLVGVRPLSDHYLSLYGKELRELRPKVKPGLLPPFYADRPKSLDEKQESEIRYLNAYLKNPIRTDLTYFWRIVTCIIFKGSRSE